ncbi:CinA family protein [uncultured Bartonella sp.]|uniref:CinA family protein n=1 Tax=uncultured Bartonella sp. TaxID=104108 RepID=UPI002627E400|nr:CinA family protein [uncultured Bartonella sp.]
MTLIAEDKANRVLDACRQHNLKLATVESCTGGLIIASLTDIAGSSDVVECGFITYSNEAKEALVGVSRQLIDDVGAVSQPVAVAMAEGALEHSRADIAVSVTGIAGPGGGTAEKPVGLVHMAVACKGKPTHHHEAHFGTLGREKVRQATVERALGLILEILHKTK